MAEDFVVVTPIVPEGLEVLYDDWHMSPALVYGNIVVVSGVTAATFGDAPPQDAAEEFTLAFDNVVKVLAAAKSRIGDVVEMTTFHVRLRDHIEVFREVRDRYVIEPYPTWTAIGTTELITPGTRIEIRTVGLRSTSGPSTQTSLFTPRKSRIVARSE